MDPLLQSLALILLALLGTRLGFSTLRVPPGPRLLFRTGVHFLFIGMLLGPLGLDFISRQATGQLEPLVAIGLGWVGFLFGLQLDRESLGRFPRSFLVFAVGQAVLTFVLAAVLGMTVAGALGARGTLVLLLVLLAAATAAVSTPAAIAMVSTNFFVRGEVRRLIFFTASLDAVIGLLALQGVYSFFPPSDMVQGLPIDADPAWSGMAIGLGVILGILFLWLNRGRLESEERVLFVLGIAALGSGAAFQLQLSPLLVCTVMGIVVANLSPDRQRVYKVLQNWEKPIYLLLLLLAGALLELPTVWVVPLALAYLLVRGAAKLVAGAVAAAISGLPFDPPRRIGLGLIPQGGISLAMAISVLITYEGLQIEGIEAAELFFEAVVIGVVLSELLGPVFTTSLLRRAGEISPRVERALEEGDEDRARREALKHSPPHREGSADRAEEEGTTTREVQAAEGSADRTVGEER